jgi:MarR family transcriptional regulator, organic hydroperoxide resistance regulator
MDEKAVYISEIFDNLRRVVQVIREYSMAAKRETDITGPQLWAIKLIANAQPIQVSELASRMYLHPATVVGILNRLEIKDLVKRIRTADDRRVVHVELTALGRDLVRRAPEVAQGVLVSGLETLPDEKIKNIHGGLAQLVEILGAQEIPPHLISSPEVNYPGEIKSKKKRARKKEQDLPIA